MAKRSLPTTEPPADAPVKLARPSERCHRDSHAIEGEAVVYDVDHEPGIIEQIEDGLAVCLAGRVVRHDDAMRKARRLIEGISV